MFCVNCGARLDDDALFCPNCGTRQNPEEEKPKQADPFGMPPAPVAPAPPPIPVDAEADIELHHKPSAGKVFISILLCILIFVSILGAGVLGALRMSYSGEKLRKILGNIEVDSITMPNLKTKESVSLVDFIENVSGFDFEKTAGIKKANLEKFLSKSYVQDLFTDTVVGYAQYFMNGKTPETLTEKDVLKFIKKHNDDIYSLTGFSFVYKDPATGKDKVYDVDVSNAFKDLGTDELTPEFLEKMIGISFGPVKFVLSAFGVFTLAAVVVLLSILVLLLHKKTKYSGYSFVGMTIMISGAAIAGLAGVLKLIIGKWKSTFVNALVSPFAKNMLMIGGSILILGLLIFVIGRAVCTRKAKKKLGRA